MKRNQGKKNHLDPNLSQDHSLGLGQNLDQGLGLVLSPVATDSTKHDFFFKACIIHLLSLVYLNYQEYNVAMMLKKHLSVFPVPGNGYN